MSSETMQYVVQPGDTLSAIARRFCGDYLIIARENRITDPDWIYAGKTVLQLTNRCAYQTPQVSTDRNVSPGEFASDGRASREKHIPPLATRDSASSAQSISELRHRDIYRIVTLRAIGARHRTAEQQSELTHLSGLIRQEVLSRYRLPNADCLYVSVTGDWETRTLTRVRCIRENYGDVINEVTRGTGLPAAYLEAIILVESGGQPDAISPTGCTGVKQFTRRSAQRFGLTDRFDPFESIRAGGRHLQDNLRVWRGDIAKATAHYNIGSATVAARGFNAQVFPYTQSVFRVQRLIEQRAQRVSRDSSVPMVAPAR